MDNLQANLRVAQVAGMWLADGYVSSGIRQPDKRSKYRSIRLTPLAGYTSKDYDYIEFIADVLKENGIGCHIHQRKPVNDKRAPIWDLRVSGYKRFRAWFELFADYIFGRKFEAGQVLYSCWDPNHYGQGIRKSEAQSRKEIDADKRVKELNSMGASETIITGTL